MSKWSHVIPTGHANVSLLASSDPGKYGATVGAILADCKPTADDTTATYANQLADFLGIDYDAILHTDSSDTPPLPADVQRFTPRGIDPSTMGPSSYLT
jgi:hypothetical protein